MSKNKEYFSLRHMYPTFDYESYSYNIDDEGLHLEFCFRMGDVTFRPTALIERRRFLDFDVEKSLLDRLVFEIGMAELVSYWKCACPPKVRVLCGSVNKEQKIFWLKLYWNGLGEFFYTNEIESSQEDFMQIEAADSLFHYPNVEKSIHLPKATLVPIGGGKDSVVTLELLRQNGRSVRPLIMNPRGATKECARIGGFPMEDVLIIRRTIDSTLLSLNAKGYLNGHTPFSAMLAFYTLLCSAVSGVTDIALSNEGSANEPTVIGSTVNHQYSKSIEFENDFREYVGNEYGNRFRYYSFLRPLAEIQIAMLFSRLTQYHDVFRSCNVGSKLDIWCGHCAKCLFAYIILSPFIKLERLNQIFGKSMLDDLSLEHEFRQLTGEAETKPFECVGTVNEVIVALTMLSGQLTVNGGQFPALLKDFKPGKLIDLTTITSEGNLNKQELEMLHECIILCIEKID